MQGSKTLHQTQGPQAQSPQISSQTQAVQGQLRMEHQHSSMDQLRSQKAGPQPDRETLPRMESVSTQHFAECFKRISQASNNSCTRTTLMLMSSMKNKNLRNASLVHAQSSTTRAVSKKTPMSSSTSTTRTRKDSDALTTTAVDVEYQETQCRFYSVFAVLSATT